MSDLSGEPDRRKVQREVRRLRRMRRDRRPAHLASLPPDLRYAVAAAIAGRKEQ